jgi:hypothetical protein
MFQRKRYGYLRENSSRFERNFGEYRRRGARTSVPPNNLIAFCRSRLTSQQTLTEQAKVILEAARAKKSQAELVTGLHNLKASVEPTLQALKAHATANGVQGL